MLTNQQIETIVKRVCEWNRIGGNKGKYNQELEDNLFNEEDKEFKKAQKEWNREEGLDGVIDMIIVYIGTLYKDDNSFDYICERINRCFESSPIPKERYIRKSLKTIKPFVSDFYGAFLHILDSNDSKFIKNEKGELVAIKDEDGKIQKGPNYFKPDLSPFIKKSNE